MSRVGTSEINKNPEQLRQKLNNQVKKSAAQNEENKSIANAVEAPKDSTDESQKLRS